MRMLVVNPSNAPLPAGLESAVSCSGWTLDTQSNLRSAGDAIASCDIAAVLVLADRCGEPGTAESDLDSLLAQLAQRRITTMVVASDEVCAAAKGASPYVELVAEEFSAAELRGRLKMIERYHGLLHGMEREIQNMERVSAQLREHFQLVEQEMRLAGRLQRDFLPPCDGRFGSVRFSVLYRPASWVSGDIFDVIRIDDRHTGVFIADAVGHGMAAALLTMFMKRTVALTGEAGQSARLRAPAEVLSNLNDALAAQKLPNCQFVTACYGVLDHDARCFTCARGGHPAPLLFRANGTVTEIDPAGGLLGIRRGESFEVQETKLEARDKLLLFTDGLELSFQEADTTFNAERYQGVLRSLAGRDVETIVSELRARLDAESGSIEPRDDVTVIGLQVMPDAD